MSRHRERQIDRSLKQQQVRRDAEADRKGLRRFYKNENDRGYFTTEKGLNRT